jgi:hypothetical protein
MWEVLRTHSVFIEEKEALCMAALSRGVPGLDMDGVILAAAKLFIILAQSILSTLITM